LRKYEALIITQVKPSREGVQGEQAAFEEAVRKQEGKIVGHTDLGKRTLGYRVKKMREGQMTIYDFELIPAKVESLKRILHRSDDILRFMVTSKPEAALTRTKPRAKQNVPVTAKR